MSDSQGRDLASAEKATGPDRPGEPAGADAARVVETGGPGSWRPSSVLRERSPQEIVLDHAVLSHQLAQKVYALQDAVRTGRDAAVELTDLQQFVSSDLESYVRSLMGVLREDSDTSRLAAGLRRLPLGPARRHEREHQRLLEAFAQFEQASMGTTVASVDQATAEGQRDVRDSDTEHPAYPAENVTPAEAARQAVFISRLWNAHAAEEDAHFLRLTESDPSAGVASEEPSEAEARVVLGAQLLAELTCEHRELAGLVELAKVDAGTTREVVPAARATAALSSHANQVAVHLYPAINAAVPGSRELNDRCSTAIFEAARTMLEVERALGVDAAASAHTTDELIARVEELIAAHARDDEELLNAFIAQAPITQLSRLLSAMRPGVTRPQTRPHFAAQNPTPLGRAGAYLHRRFDQLLDELDNRAT